MERCEFKKKEKLKKKDKENGWRFYLFDQSDFLVSISTHALKADLSQISVPKQCLADTPFLVQSVSLLSRYRKQPNASNKKSQLRMPVYARPSSALCFQRMTYRSHAGACIDDWVFLAFARNT